MSVVMLVALRLDNAGWAVPDTGGYRRLNWEYSRARWGRLLPDVPIFEGYDDGDHVFSPARALNRAARWAGGWESAIYVGADFIVSSRAQVRDAIALSQRKRQFTIAHSRTTMMHEKPSQTVRAGAEPNESMGDTSENPFTGICVVPRRVWDEVDGFDERFEGWGWEDQAFWASCWAMGGGFQRVNGTAYHLWHPRTRADNEESVYHIRNEPLGRRYIAARGNPIKMREIIAERP